MKRLILIFISAIICQTATAEVNLIVGTGGYTGRTQIGIEKKGFAFIYGNTDAINQFTLRYDHIFLNYFTAGIFLTYTTDNRYFIDNPSRYPSSRYYKQTAMRLGLSFGIKYKYFYINTNILDTGLSMIVNESKYRSNMGWLNKYLWSTGAGIRISF